MTPNVDPPDSARQASSPPTDRVVAVMEMLGADPRRQFSLAEITRALGISRATGHAIMASLTAHDWVTRNPASAKYAWGPAIASLAKPADLNAFRGELEALAATTGTQVLLARREGHSLVVRDLAGQSLAAPAIARGTRIPFVAPFGRDYVAWLDDDAQRRWLEGIGAPSDSLRERMSAVLKETRKRGFVVERLSREYLRVYSALRALADEGEIDSITAQLARAFAELSVIDILPAELAGDTSHRIATISAPITDPDGLVTMSVSAGMFATLDAAAITGIGEQVVAAAQEITARVNRFGGSAALEATP